MTSRDKQILCGLFLSKFDQEGLAYLGFESFIEAFNALGYGLQARPASIKNYRDEIDPLFPNSRMGWHKRQVRSHCKALLDEYGNLGISEMGKIVRTFLQPDLALDTVPGVRDVLSVREINDEKAFSRRLITGRAAENYFDFHFQKLNEFSDCVATNTSDWGCGFDFKLERLTSGEHFAVEVKGIRERSGSILMTDLEYRMAVALNERYFLFVVRNFAERPFHTIVRNPAKSNLEIKRIEKDVKVITWKTNIE